MILLYWAFASVFQTWSNAFSKWSPFPTFYTLRFILANVTVLPLLCPRVTLRHSCAPALQRACAPHPVQKRPPRRRRTTVRIPISLPASLSPYVRVWYQRSACRRSRASTQDADSLRLSPRRPCNRESK